MCYCKGGDLTRGMMVCQMCGKSSAEVIIQKEGEVLHLCKDCAFEYLKKEKVKQDIQGKIQNVVSAIPVIAATIVQAPKVEVPPIQCGVCGYTFREFTMHNMFGCPACYESFASPLRKMLSHHVDTPRHRGKCPARAYKGKRIQKLIVQLKEQMEKEVAKEDYETAARIRDTIRSLEKEID